jgi:hypothetical protein
VIIVLNEIRIFPRADKTNFITQKNKGLREKNACGCLTINITEMRYELYSNNG